ncbi:MAG: phage/plasmid primase, P4 family [Mycobacterium sp.]
MIQFSDTTLRITGEPRPDHINTLNAMVDWRTGALLPHSPDYLSTVQLPVEYDEKAECPAFETFLTQVLPPDCYTPTEDSPQGFIWELIGYTMYSGNPLHIAILLRGIGRNGKGTLIRVLKALLGGNNTSAVGLHDLTENRFRTATLYGKLANLAGDLDSKWINNTAAFKAITGGDTVQAEEK